MVAQRARMLRSRSHGFTLVEVLIATGLLVTLAAGTAQLFAIAIRHSIAARQQLAMTLAASKKIDELSAPIARGDVTMSPAGSLDRDAPGFNDVVVEAGGAFRRRWLVAPATANLSTMVAIVIRVEPVARGATTDYEVATLREVGQR